MPCSQPLLAFLRQSSAWLLLRANTPRPVLNGGPIHDDEHLGASPMAFDLPLGADAATLGLELAQEAQQELLAQPHCSQPRYSPTIWVASCRRNLTQFGENWPLLLYRPDIRTVCPFGSRCRLKERNPAHARLCIHYEEALDKPHEHTVVVNSDECSPLSDFLRIPNVPKAWDVSPAKLLAGDSGAGIEGLPRNRVVIVWV